MIIPCQSWGWWLGLAGFFAVGGASISADYAVAQITPDATLGNESSFVTPNVEVGGFPSERIDGGALRGANLFHSFSEFNVGEGFRVYFANPAGIENILSRVTGTDPSDILGTLGVDGGANLFLLNPNGIIFGANAKLDIAGSFVASTADSLVFENGSVFSATNPEAPPLLTINLTPGLQYGANHSGVIANAGKLAVGQDLTLSAGNLELEGQLHAGRDLTLQAQDTVQVRDRILTPFIASAGDQLIVQGNQWVDIFALNHPDSGFFSGGDMVLRSANTVGGDAHYWSGGNFRIEQLDGNLGSLFSPNDPVIRSIGDVSLFAYEGTSLHILAGGQVDINTVVITGPDTVGDTINPTATPNLANVTLSDGTPLVIDGSTRPTLDVRAGMNPAAIGDPLGTIGDSPDSDTFYDDSISPVPPPINNPAATSANITIGDIYVNVPNGVVFLTTQYEPNTSLTGGDITITGAGVFGDGIDVRGFDGDGGSVILDSRSNLALTNGFIDSSSVLGNSGDITLIANQGISLANGTYVDAGTYGQGDAGNIRIQANGAVVIESGNIFSNVERGAVGEGGEITITAGSVSLLDGAQVQASIRGSNQTLPGGRGNAGNINISVRDAFTIAGANSDGFPSAIFSTVGAGAEGDAGDITINAGSLSLVGDATFITSSTFGQGDAGNITIHADSAVSIEGGEIFNNVERGAVGEGGEINITAGSLSLLGGSQLQASVREADQTLQGGQGNAGDINIDVRNAVTIAGADSDGLPSAIFSNVGAGAEGDAGDITINAGSLTLTDGTLIDSNTFGQGDAGSVTIHADSAVSLEGANIFNNVERGAVGEGGEINITAESLSLLGGSQLQASVREADQTLQGGRGNAGDINIDVGDAVTIAGVNSDGLSSAIFSNVGAGAEGDAGDITINAGSFSLTGDANSISSSTFGRGDAGSVTIQADGAVNLEGGDIFSNVERGAVGEGGEINITAGSLSLVNGAQLQTLVRGTDQTLPGGQGNAGNVNIDVHDAVTISGVGSDGLASAIFSAVQSGAEGNAGDITIDAGSFSLTGDANSISSSTFGRGDAGRVTIQADGAVSIEGGDIFSNVESGAVGEGGDITITAESLSLLNGTQLQTLVRGIDQTLPGGRGNAGDVNIDVRDAVTLAGLGNDGLASRIASNVSAGAEGNGGNISIQAGSLSASDGGQLRSDTLGEGDAGNITIQAGGAVSFDGLEVINGVVTASGAASYVGNELQQGLVGTGKGGDITIAAGSLSLTNGAALNASTFGQGDAGDVNVNVRDAVTVSGFATAMLNGVNFGYSSTISSSVGLGAVGDGGNINIEAESLSMNDFSVVATGTFGQGDAGNVSVQVDDFVTLTNLSNIRSSVEQGGIGNGGDIDIQARSLTLTDGGEIIVDVFAEDRNLPGGTGEGGNIRIDASDFVNISGFSTVQLPIADPFNPSDNFQTEGYPSGLFASTRTGATGPAGSITVTTGDFRLANGATVYAFTNNPGDAGDITINANTFEATGGGQVSTTAGSSGRAGNITLNITDSVTLAGSDPTFADRLAIFGRDTDAVGNQGESGLFANTTSSSTGDGGAIVISSPRQVTLTDGAKIAVDSQGQGRGGSLLIEAGSLTLNNGASISAATASGEGGNLTLQIEDILLLRHNSLISAEAGGTGNGGNITIDTDFIVAVPEENSDIVANAFEGRGGNINITAQGIFGTQFRPRLTPLSDITASSELGVDGVVAIDTPNVDPSQGLAELPTNLVDATGLVDRSCTAGRGSAFNSSFTVTGRGGLPSNPTEPLNSDAVLADWVTLDSEGENPPSAATDSNPSSSPPEQIVEAQGWIKTPDGQVILTAEAPTVTPHSPRLTSLSCQGSQTATH